MMLEDVGQSAYCAIKPGTFYSFDFLFIHTALEHLITNDGTDMKLSSVCCCLMFVSGKTTLDQHAVVVLTVCQLRSSVFVSLLCANLFGLFPSMGATRQHNLWLILGIKTY